MPSRIRYYVVSCFLREPMGLMLILFYLQSHLEPDAHPFWTLLSPIFIIAAISVVLVVCIGLWIDRKHSTNSRKNHWFLQVAFIYAIFMIALPGGGYTRR
jgi:hypothetical protein